MKVYRMKHIPSGLYYCPSREIRPKGDKHKYLRVKSNLSEKGKLYTKKPSLSWIGDRCYTHLVEGEHVTDEYFMDLLKMGFYSINFPVIEDEWMIEEID